MYLFVNVKVNQKKDRVVHGTAVSFQQAIVRICEVRLTDPQKKNLEACLLGGPRRKVEGMTFRVGNDLVVSFVGVSFVGQCDILTC